MKKTLLRGNTWSQITREERYFCAKLFEAIEKNKEKFLKWMKMDLEVDIDTSKYWDIGFEVCFYRDYWHKFKNKSSRSAKLPSKRTFDLALFSDHEIIIIEAKVHEVFETKQIDDVKKDKRLLKELFGDDLKIRCFALASSGYFENSKTYDKELSNPTVFDKKITWYEMAVLFDEPLFLRANQLRYEK